MTLESENRRGGSLLDLIAEATDGNSVRTIEHSLDADPVSRFPFDENHDRIKWKKYGETVEYDRSVDLTDRVRESGKGRPLFSFFLDGSRRTYRAGDISYDGRLFPVIAGQVGIGCCRRDDDGNLHPHAYCRSLLISVPQKAKLDAWENDSAFEKRILREINGHERLLRFGVAFDAVTTYSFQDGDRLEDKGVATIQAFMSRKEQEMVADLAQSRALDDERQLLKDGSLEYMPRHATPHELNSFKANFRCAVGASKTFNPAGCVDRKGKNVSELIARLRPFHRTPVQMFTSEINPDVAFAVWYVRIRGREHARSPFDGILRLEKVLFDVENALNSETVDALTASIVNERSPVCYGSDSRWTKHLYPIYATESFVKSRYLSEDFFISLF